MDYDLFPANVTASSVVERNGMGKQEALSRDYQGLSTASDSLRLTDAVDDEEEKPQPVVAHKKGRKSESGGGGKTLGYSLSLLRSENKLWGFGRRDRRSWKFEEEMVVK
jgi:hypothetical protein